MTVQKQASSFVEPDLSVYNIAKNTENINGKLVDMDSDSSEHKLQQLSKSVFLWISYTKGRSRVY